MRVSTVGKTAKDLFHLLSAGLKRMSMIYLTGGHEGEWGYVRVTGEVVDVNTKMPIRGHVMRKIIGGQWVYRQMTEEEREDFDASRRW
ncbi:hypothetical protein [Rhizobium sp. BK418]|uniref:hypothetical protein n=1 Tax=Rhizobium sp. BK418 TaxID=2512120 RepID=UPI001050A9A6|nr:hypothetical protein [Rhizobium sp. BK418]TCS05359.1 hypothetical protein EV281_1031042 [Rhizobium sp. BK418]